MGVCRRAFSAAATGCGSGSGGKLGGHPNSLISRSSLSAQACGRHDRFSDHALDAPASALSSSRHPGTLLSNARALWGPPVLSNWDRRFRKPGVSLTAVALAQEHCFWDHCPHPDPAGASAAAGGSMWRWPSSSALGQHPPHLDGHAGAVEALGEQHVLALQLVVRACEHQLRSTGSSLSCSAASSPFCRRCRHCLTNGSIRVCIIALNALGASANAPSHVASSQRPALWLHHCQKRSIAQVQKTAPS